MTNYDPHVAKRKCQMEKDEIISYIIILDQHGLHMRPAAQFTWLVSQFHSEVTLSYLGRSSSGRSILGILALSATRGAKVCISIKGSDAEKVARALHIFSKLL